MTWKNSKAECKPCTPNHE